MAHSGGWGFGPYEGDVDADGSTTIAKHVGGAQMTTVIDSRGLTLSQSLETTGVATIERELSTIDAALRPTAWFMGAASSQVGYDQAGRVAADTALGSVPGEPITEPSGGDVQIAGLPPAGVNFTYDPATGRKTGEEFIFTFGGTEESSSYSYTSMGRLASADIGGTSTTYAYELGSGNLTSMTRSSETTSFTYGDGNRLASMSGPHGTVGYGWDTTRGWRTSAQASGQSAVSFAYDDAGRLTSYTDPNTQTTASHLYDAEGQRVRSVLVQDSITTTTTYVYEGLLLQAYTAKRSDGATSSLTYLYDEHNDPIAGVYASSETSTIAFTVISTDRGDVRELQDASGASFAFYAYDAYGVPTSSLSTATASVDATLAATIAEANVLRYAGYCYDEHSGMYYLSQRYYDPATASFITKDPAKADGEESAYQYCGGDPVGNVDPSGEWKDTTFHRDVSKAIAKSSGIRASYVDWLGYGAREIDLNPFAWSLGPVGYKYHFNTRATKTWDIKKAYFAPGKADSRKDAAASFKRQAENYVLQGRRDLAARMLGRGLHPLQDIYAHGNLVQHLILKQGFLDKRPDDPNYWSSYELGHGLPKGWRAAKAKSESRSYLSSFKYLAKLK
jgi:RHS repeat-associated protein